MVCTNGYFNRNYKNQKGLNNENPNRLNMWYQVWNLQTSPVWFHYDIRVSLFYRILTIYIALVL